MPILQLGDIQLYYDEYGSGDRYLFSAQQDHSKICSFTKTLADHGFHVFNIQLRGYGQSSHVTGEGFGARWYDVWAQDVCDFADTMGIDRFFYGGISHGAGIGWYLCRYHAERVRGFFSIVGGPHSKDGAETGEERMKVISAARAAIEGDAAAWEAFREMRIRSAAPQFSGQETPEEIARKNAVYEETVENLRAMTPEEGIINPLKPFPHAKTEEALIEELRRIKTPTIHIGGMRDHIIFPENLIRSCAAVENSKLIIYSDCTHDVAQEREAELVEDILAFCRQRNLFD